MPTFTHPRLREIEAFLDAVRADLAGVVASTPRAAMARVPATGWSGAQVLQHLGKVEGATAKMLERLFADAAGQLPAETDESTVLRSLDRLAGADAIVRPLVAPERLRPDPAPDPDASWASLQGARQRLLAAYRGVDGRALAQVDGPHPLLGPLNAYEWLLFIGKHELRHVGQLNRILQTS